MGQLLTPDAVWRKAKREGWAHAITSERHERAACRGCWYSEPHADHVINFFRRYLVHTKGRWEGQPFDPLPWQEHDLIRPLFGWMRPNHTRRFRIAYVEIPKKNGKSTLAAGVALYLLVGDGEAGAEIYSAAVDRKQAMIVFREANLMQAANPDLSAVLRSFETTKRLTFESTNSFYTALSKETISTEGINAHGIVFDELHVQRTRELWDALRYAGASRSQWLLFAITTAGFDRETICWEQHEYAQRVLAGEIEDDAFFPYIAAASEDDDWTLEETWKKANPSYGETIDPDDFREAAKEAQQKPASENTFKRYRLNIWTQQETRWIPMDQWRKCGAIPKRETKGLECYAGLDLASTRDTCSFVRIFPDGTGGIDVEWMIWIPKEGMLERERRDAVPYTEWHRRGTILATEGTIADYDVIMEGIKAAHETTPTIEIAVDPHNATHLITSLSTHGLKMTPFTQTIVNYTSPCKLLERLLEQGKIRHGGHPVADWQASNVTVKTNANEDMRPVKPKPDSPKKIDAIAALLMAIGRWQLEEDRRCLYESSGIRTI